MSTIGGHRQGFAPAPKRRFEFNLMWMSYGLFLLLTVMIMWMERSTGVAPVSASAAWQMHAANQKTATRWTELEPVTASTVHVSQRFDGPHVPLLAIRPRADRPSPAAVFALTKLTANAEPSASTGAVE